MENKIFKTVIAVVSVLILVLIAGRVYRNVEEDIGQMRDESVKQVELYTKEGCAYCVMAQTLLDRYGIGYHQFDITHNEDLQNKLFAQTRQNTVPYIFIKGQFIGGYSQLVEIANKGGLQDMVSALIKEQEGK